MTESELQAARRELERVLASPGFVRNDRLGRFLRFVVEKHLEGRDDEVKESVLAVEIFGRSPDHNSRQDSIVRTEASRLRARLREYYLAEGKDDPVTIELPKGGYRPVFRHLEQNAPQPSHPRRLWLMLAAALLLAAAAAARWWVFNWRGEPVDIAVMPLENLGHDPANDYFVDGLTAEIIRNLSVLEGLVVRSQTSSFAFRGKTREVHEAGKELSADYLLEGSVLRAGQQLRVNAQLVRVRDDSPVWSGRFDRELTDVFAIQDEISRGIVNSLRLKLGRGRRRYETSVEAYDLYLRAIATSIQPGGANEISLFEEAIAKDPSFAPAYAGLAATYAIKATAGGASADQTLEDMHKMRDAAEKAIRLDPLLAEAHAAMGMVYARQAQWAQAERSFRRSLELDPNRATTHMNFSDSFLLPLGRVEEAVQQARLAVRADPLSSSARGELIYTLLSSGRFDEAANGAQTLPAKGGFLPQSQLLGRARLGQGRLEEAIQLLANEQNKGLVGYAYARSGRRDEAEKLAAEYLERRNGPQVTALIYAGLGDKDRTLEALDRLAAARGPIRLGLFLTFPELSLLHADPRVKALRRKWGLPD